jgi:hypothetical protein
MTSTEIAMLIQRDQWNAAEEVKQGLNGWGAIPEASRFLLGTQHGYAVPVEIHGWQWSETFRRWSALVTFEDGWRGYTYPEPASLVIPEGTPTGQATD